MTDSKPKIVWRLLLAIAYLIAGIAHLRSPAGFLAITPDWVPAPELVIKLTGIAEICAMPLVSGWLCMRCLSGPPISTTR